MFSFSCIYIPFRLRRHSFKKNLSLYLNVRYVSVPLLCIICVICICLLCFLFCYNCWNRFIFKSEDRVRKKNRAQIIYCTLENGMRSPLARTSVERKSNRILTILTSNSFDFLRLISNQRTCMWYSSLYVVAFTFLCLLRLHSKQKYAYILRIQSAIFLCLSEALLPPKRKQSDLRRIYVACFVLGTNMFWSSAPRSRRHVSYTKKERTRQTKLASSEGRDHSC